MNHRKNTMMAATLLDQVNHDATQGAFSVEVNAFDAYAALAEALGYHVEVTDQDWGRVKGLLSPSSVEASLRRLR